MSIGIEFLGRRYYAQDPQSAKLRAEWPPHPDRLFSALVASAYARAQDSTLDMRERAALIWLEKLPAPQWSGPVALGKGRLIQTFAPTNAVDPRGAGAKRLIQLEALPEFRSRQPRDFASIAVDRPGYWTWPDADAQPHSAALQRLVEGVVRLGASMSFVRLWLEPHPPAPTLIPSRAIEEPLAVRLPYAGRLHSLEQAYAAGRRPSFSVPVAYAPPRPVTEQASAVVVPWGLTYFMAFDPPNGASIAQGLAWTHALRRAVLARASENKDIPAALHGHVTAAHCAFVAVPDVGFEHSNGHLLGMAVLLPRALTQADCEAIYRALARVDHLVLRRQSYGLIPVASLPPNRVPYGMRKGRWAGVSSGSTKWMSVTPVVFDRFPKHRQNILFAIQTMARWAGLPNVRSAQLIGGEALPGVPPAQEFIVRRSSSDSPRFVGHVALEFAEPVHGPVLMGQLRNFGLGLFIPAP